MSNQPMSKQFEDKYLEELAQVLAGSVPYAPPPSPRFTAELRQKLMASYEEPVGWRFGWLSLSFKAAVAFTALVLIITAGGYFLNALPLPELEPLAEPTVFQATVTPEPTATAAPTATAVQSEGEIPVVGGAGSLDSLGITAVSPAPDILTQTTTFTVTVRYQLHSIDSAYIDLKLVEVMGNGGRGLYSQQLPITATSGTLTTTLVFRPRDVSGPATVGLRAEMKTDPRAIPLNITMPPYRWQYQPADER
jgi:hypothetical protein